MTRFKNIVEDIVVEEARAQLESVSDADRNTLQLNEVVAYALNHLPPMYASTDRGWLQQRKRAYSELGAQVAAAVELALLRIAKSPDRQSDPLPLSEIESPALTLSKLQALLDRPNLKWEEVPKAVEQAIQNVKYGVRAGDGLLSATNRQQVRDVQAYLQRSRSQGRSWRNRASAPPPAFFSTEAIEAREFESYMLPTSCYIINALEKAVMTAVEEQMQRLSSVLSRPVRPEDAAVYALNRLPPMYATSARGLEIQRQRVASELNDEVISTVVQALLTLSKTPRRLVKPLPLTRFEAEQDAAIAELRLLLQRDDITWRNAADLVEVALEEAQRDGGWRQRWKMLGQVYNELQLEPGDADLSIQQTEHGETLVLRAYTREAFGVLSDNPRVVGRIALKFFPDLACIELWYSLLGFPLTYTRDEMLADDLC